MQFILCLLFFAFFLVPTYGELGAGPRDGEVMPKDWGEDFAQMVKHGHCAPELRETFGALNRIVRRGLPHKVTREYRYALFSIRGGLLGLRIGKSAKDGFYSNILIGVHPEKTLKLPPFPVNLPAEVGGVRLLARKSEARPHPPVAEEAEHYFGEPCTAYVYGAGHWITRFFVRNDRILAISFALEP